MGIDHERIHIETSSVLIRQLPINMVHKPEGYTIAPDKYGKCYITPEKGKPSSCISVHRFRTDKFSPGVITLYLKV